MRTSRFQRPSENNGSDENKDARVGDGCGMRDDVVLILGNDDLGKKKCT